MSSCCCCSENSVKRSTRVSTLSPNETDQVGVLRIHHIDLLNNNDNARKHNTSKYKVQPVFRRGQEFIATLTFDRDYQKSIDDLTFIFRAAKEDTTNHLYAEFKLNKDSKANFKDGKVWGAKIFKAGNRQLMVEVYISGKCVVGLWDLEIKASLEGKDEDYTFMVPKPVFILFNPWSKADPVLHFTEDKDLLGEYVLNEVGTVYRGSHRNIGSSSWFYGQFQEDILRICVDILKKAFDFKMTADMADPEIVARALSRIVNSLDDNGVVVGRWISPYDGGRSPGLWTSSTEILRLYDKSKAPVKFGQCWVFAHVLITVCRSLGFPCRNVTNFNSAHDANSTCTVEMYLDIDGSLIKQHNGDSIWNFHVWNEVWLCPQNLDDIYKGWHVIDATPQEQSEGTYQCGPCPVEAVKRGEITVGLDTAFVFSEVNADIFVTQKKEDGGTRKSVRTSHVGKKISTKPPDGKPHRQDLHLANQDDVTLRMDLTDNYKFREGSKEEREAAARAARRGLFADKYDDYFDLEVLFDTSKQTVLGRDLVISAKVKNVSKEDKTVQVIIVARSCRYWNFAKDNKLLGEENIPCVPLKPGEETPFTLTVKAADYMNKVNEDFSVFGYVCATDMDNRMPYSTHEIFMISPPELVVKGPTKAKSGETVEVKVSLINELTTTMTNCMLSLTGPLELVKDDVYPVHSYFETTVITLKDIPAQESVTATLRLVGKLNPDDKDEDTTKTMGLTFRCREVDIFSSATYSLQLQKS